MDGAGFLDGCQGGLLRQVGARQKGSGRGKRGQESFSASGGGFHAECLAIGVNRGRTKVEARRNLVRWLGGHFVFSLALFEIADGAVAGRGRRNGNDS